MFILSMLFLLATIVFAVVAFGGVAVTWTSTALILFVASLALFIVLFVVAMLQRPPNI